MMLRIRGVGKDRELLLRVKWQDRGGKGVVLLEKRLQFSGGGGKRRKVQLKGQTQDDVSFELWANSSTGFLKFVKGWSVDLQQWIGSGGNQRWFAVDGSSDKKPGYVESAAELEDSAAYVCISIAGDQDKKSVKAQERVNDVPGFRFVLPHREVSRSSKFRDARVGEILHQRRTDILCDLLPVALYGTTRRQYHAVSSKTKSGDDGVAKSLVLLQLSCQYANYCVSRVDRHSSKLDRRSRTYSTMASRIRQRQRILKEQKTSLQRESEMLSSSVDKMRMLLQEIDPEALAKLQDHNVQISQESV